MSRALRAGVACLATLIAGAVSVSQEKPPVMPSATDPMAESATVPTAEGELPRADEMSLPTADELLTGARRDWLVLQDGRLLVVEPIYPRPGTLAKIQAERDAIMDDPRRRFSEEGKERLKELVHLGVLVPEGGRSTEFQIEIREIGEIIHHEDLMLRRAGRLIEEGDTRRAFELLFVVSRTDPTWPGLDARRIELTIADAGRLIAENDGDRALALIESLYELEKVPEDAGRLLEKAAALLIGEPLAKEDYRRARYGLARVRQVDPKHPVLATWTGRLTERAKALRDEAERASSDGDDARARKRIEAASRAWPKLDGLRSIHARLTDRYQRLTVAVPQLASEAPMALTTPADERVDRLTTADLFEIDGFAAVPSYRGVYFERWEPTDLGRRARFEMRQTLPPWASRPSLTTLDALHLFEDRLRRGGLTFDARFADLVSTVRPLGPYGFEVVFNRAPLRAEAVLARPPLYGGARPTDELFRRFAEVERTEDRVTYHRAHREERNERHVAEVVEIRYPGYEKAVQAFDRGDVRMLVDVPPWDMPRLQEDKRYVMTKLALPATHLLQFHPASKAFESPELRRAVAAAADADELLRVIAGTGAETSGRLVTAPYATTHLGYDPLVKPRPYDLPLALALVLAAEKRFGGTLPEIVFAASSEPSIRGAAEKLASTWKRIGLPVRLVTFEELGPEGRWDVAYRELSIADPVTALGPLITLDASMNVASLSALPDWLRQRLLDLERASDAATVQAVLIDLHRMLYADVRYVPLFEVDRFLVTRGTIRGLSERPVAVYQNVERWVLPPDYPDETP